MPDAAQWDGEKAPKGPRAVENPEWSLPPWERKNPAYGLGSTKDEKSGKPVSVRLTAKEYRDLERIVQHRKIPQIENYSDVLRVSFQFMRYWYNKHYDDPHLREELDLQAWEAERLTVLNQRNRVATILDALRADMSEAHRRGYKNKLRGHLDELSRYRKKILDEDLRGQAAAMWVDYNEKLKQL